MANPEHVARLKEGAEAWNAWRKTTDEQVDLEQVELRNFDLSGFDLSRANLIHLRGALLYESRIDFCEAKNVDFGDAVLSSSHLRVIVLAASSLH